MKHIVEMKISASCLEQHLSQLIIQETLYTGAVAYFYKSEIIYEREIFGHLKILSKNDTFS